MLRFGSPAVLRIPPLSECQNIRESYSFRTNAFQGRMAFEPTGFLQGPWRATLFLSHAGLVWGIAVDHWHWESFHVTSTYFLPLATNFRHFPLLLQNNWSLWATGSGWGEHCYLPEVPDACGTQWYSVLLCVLFAALWTPGAGSWFCDFHFSNAWLWLWMCTISLNICRTVGHPKEDGCARASLMQSDICSKLFSFVSCGLKMPEAPR